MIEIYSGRGGYVVFRPNGAWAFVHDVLPSSWIHISGSGLTVWTHPWAALPEGALWIPTVRAFAAPWADGNGPLPEDGLPWGPHGRQLVLRGPMQCRALGAWASFRLLEGEAAIAAAKDAIRAHNCARLLLSDTGPFACRAYDARRAVREAAWRLVRHDQRDVLMAQVRDDRVMIADGDWIAAAETIEEAIAAMAAAISAYT